MCAFFKTFIGHEVLQECFNIHKPSASLRKFDQRHLKSSIIDIQYELSSGQIWETFSRGQRPYKAEGHRPVLKSGPIRVIWTGTLIWIDPGISYLIINFM